MQHSDPPEPSGPPTPPVDGAPSAPPPTVPDQSRASFRSEHERQQPDASRHRVRWWWVAIPAVTGIAFVALAGWLTARGSDTEEVSDGAAIQDEYQVSEDLDAVVEDLPAPTATTGSASGPSEDIAIGDAAVVRSDLLEPEWEDDLLGDFRICGASALFDQAEASARVAFTQVRGDGPTAPVRQLTSVVLAYPSASEASVAVNADLDRTEACVGTSSLPSGATYETTAREGVSPERLACADVFASTIVELRNPDEDTPYIGQRRSFTQCGRFVALTAYLVTDPEDGFEHPDVSLAETVVTERFVELVEGN